MPDVNVVDEFFKDLPSEDKKGADIFDDKPVTPEKEEAKETPAEGDEPRKNRRHRRLEAQLEEAKARLIRAETLLEARNESATSTETDVDPRLLRIYGNETSDAREAGRLLQEAIADAAQRAEENAFNRFESRQVEAMAQQREYESFIDSELESIEDEYNVDVTSDAPVARKARREFLEMIQTLSPKDEDGTITGYADFHGTWDMYQLKRSQEKSSATTDKAKDLADRSMTKSGNVTTKDAKDEGPMNWGKASAAINRMFN